MSDQKAEELERDERDIECDLHQQVDDELVIAVATPTSNKEWQE